MGFETLKNLIFPEREHRKKTPIFLEQNAPPRIPVATPPFSAILLLQAAHARNTPPPWWIKRRRGPRGQRGRAAGAWGWLVGLAAGWWQGGRGLGLAGGSGGMGHGGMAAWKKMIGFDIYIYVYIIYMFDIGRVTAPAHRRAPGGG